MNDLLKILGFSCVVLMLSACGAQCPEGTITYLNDLPGERAAAHQSPPTHTSGAASVGVRTLLGRKTIDVDEVIRGNICNDTWTGTVYVTCAIEIPAWEQNPFFLQDCPVTIEPNSTVYVEAHRDKAYREGCSCHE